MNAAPEYLMDWIHSLDHGKRLHGFITEAYFERVLTRTRLGLNNPVFGWMTASLPGDHRQRRYWFRVTPPGYLPGAVEQALICSYSVKPASARHADRFFFLHPEPTGAPPGGRRAPLTFRVTEWGYNEKTRTVVARSGVAARTGARMHLEIVITDMDARLARHTTEQEKIRSREAPVSIREWLTRNFTENELLLLLANRCAMHLVGRFSVDRDAIDLQDGQLRFVEFKRKYPAQGWWQLAFKPSFSQHRNEAYTLGKLYRAEFESAEGTADRSLVAKKWEKEIFARLSGGGQWRRVEESSFGLDLSHVRIVQEAQDRNAVFTHVIWNDSETEIENLFYAGMAPKKPVSLVTFDLTRDSFTGIILTPGSKASAFHGQPRMQLAFPVRRGVQIADPAAR